jgi:hypothetical protein
MAIHSPARFSDYIRAMETRKKEENWERKNSDFRGCPKTRRLPPLPMRLFREQN